MAENNLIIGVDEAGRGPLAGPVFAAAVILNPDCFISGIDDSKKISEKKRDQLSPIIEAKSLAWAVGIAEVDEIDKINILQATMLAMHRAIKNLLANFDKVDYISEILIDGNKCPSIFPFTISTRAIINGDALVPAISAASIIAKVHRDRVMLALHSKYPAYGFDKHKGYGTKQHLLALQEFGPTPIHRYSFAPVRNAVV